MQPVGLALALLDLRLAVAREVAQRPDRLRRHEARLQQPRLEQLAQPGGGGDIGRAPGDLLDVAGVDEQALELVLQDRPGRLPVDTRRLHRHVGGAVRLQPIAQGEQTLHRRPELSHVLLAPPARSRNAHARRHLLLVHIQRRRTLNHRLHLKPPFRSTTTFVARGAGKAPTPN